jgi:hypothetical protein
MKVNWASSDRFREISHFFNILPYFIDRNTVFKNTLCYLQIHIYIFSHDSCILTLTYNLVNLNS